METVQSIIRIHQRHIELSVCSPRSGCSMAAHRKSRWAIAKRPEAPLSGVIVRIHLAWENLQVLWLISSHSLFGSNHEFGWLSQEVSDWSSHMAETL